MSLKSFSSIASIILFFGVVFWFFIKPKFDSKKAVIAGKVMFITLMKRSGKYEIEVNENKNVRYVYYSFADNQQDIFLGDSIFKKKNLELLVKNNQTGIVKVANDQDALIGN